jgi:hypothetical protein
MRKKMAILLAVSALFFAPAFLLLYLRYAGNRDGSAARNSPELTLEPTTRTTKGTTVFVYGHVDARTPILKDGWVAYQQDHQGWHTRRDGSSVYETTTSDYIQPLWLNTAAGPVRIEGNFALSTQTFGHATIGVGTWVAVLGEIAGQDGGHTTIRAQLVHEGDRKTLIRHFENRRAGNGGLLWFALPLLAIGLYLAVVGTGFADWIYNRVTVSTWWQQRTTKPEPMQQSTVDRDHTMAARRQAGVEILSALKSQSFEDAMAGIRSLGDHPLPGDEYCWIAKELEPLAAQAEASGDLEAARWLLLQAADRFEDYPDQWDMTRYSGHVAELRSRAQRLPSPA